MLWTLFPFRLCRRCMPNDLLTWEYLASSSQWQMLLWLAIKQKSKAEFRETKWHILDHIVCKQRSDSAVGRRWVISRHLQRYRCCCKMWGPPERIYRFFTKFFHSPLKRKSEKHSDRAGMLLEWELNIPQSPLVHAGCLSDGAGFRHQTASQKHRSGLWPIVPMPTGTELLPYYSHHGEAQSWD